MEPRIDTSRERRGVGGCLSAIAASVGMGALAGAIAGLVWGGIGGRIAMRVAFLTSNDAVRGLESDDGFEIGRFSADTLVLVVLTAIAGGMAGGAYGLARTVVRGSTRVLAVAMTVAVGAAMGAAVVDTEGIDFRLLGPLWLLVAMFVFLPAAWGFSVVVLTERFLTSSAFFPRGAPRLGAGRGRAVAGIAVWAVLVAMTVLGSVELASDVAELS